METYKIYLAGNFTDSTTYLDVLNPFDNKRIARAGQADEKQLELAIQLALSVQGEVAQLPSWKKYKILMEIAEKMQDSHRHLSELLALEAGKPWRYAKGEIDRAIQTFVVAAEEAKRHPGELLSLDWTPAGEGKQGIVKYFPVGLVAGIAPFNFPMNLAVHKLAPAIASGCPIILKPSTSTPLSTLALAKIIDETDLPKGAVSIMPMDRKTGNLLVTDDRIKLLSFTGSPAVGWKMKSQAGRKKVLLELGGNAGVIVTNSADLETAVKKCVAGAFAYSGQVCIHSQRIYVENGVFDQFATRFVELAKNLKRGAPENPDTEISAMIDEANAMRVEDWVNEAVEEGAKLLCGGQRDGSYYPPTVLTETKPAMKVCALEIFGPVVTLEPVDSFEQAVAEINNSDYGLQAAVFTNSIQQMDYAHRHLEVGGVIINDITTFRVDHMPYGGVKNSGLGREGVKYSMFEMMEPRLLVK
ncbi:MAG: aldehyde dehydrogenase family protein [Bacteroidales bacterium]|nr:aldehyde dehydrogenase family protein [Bacteroidales bacterium]